jgi:hypothetical protein
MAFPTSDVEEEFPFEMLKDAAFLAHYTIFKYIDNLPDEFIIKYDTVDELNVNNGSCSNGSVSSSDCPKVSNERALSSQLLSTRHLNENDNRNLSESEASKADSSQMNSKKLNSNDFTKNSAEYSLKTNDNENIIAKKTTENYSCLYSLKI